MAGIAFEQVTKVYPDGTRAVSSVDLEIPDGKFAVLVGPSGCGKTTLLRMVAGLEDITEGQIRAGDEVINGIPPKHRDFAMVFQNYALYPHMSVYDNMGFGLRMRGTPHGEIRDKVRPVADMLGLGEHLAKKPRLLSGGQRQRVAMGRAIVREPRAFLMDEPLSNLDAKLRVQMRSEIRRVQSELGVTTIYVTHDQTEALTMGDLVAVMRKGVLQQAAPPAELFERPANLFVAGFIGSPAMNIAEAKLERTDAGFVAQLGSAALALPDRVLADRPGLAAYEGETIALGIRPEDLEDASHALDADLAPRLRVKVDLRESMGRETYLHFDLDACPVLTDDMRELAADTDEASLGDLEDQRKEERTTAIARVTSRSRARVGDVVELAIAPEGLSFFDLRTGSAIYDDVPAPTGVPLTVA